MFHARKVAEAVQAADAVKSCKVTSKGRVVVKETSGRVIVLSRYGVSQRLTTNEGKRKRPTPCKRYMSANATPKDPGTTYTQRSRMDIPLWDSDGAVVTVLRYLTAIKVAL